MLELANARAYARQRQRQTDDAQIAELETMLDEPDAADTGPVPEIGEVPPRTTTVGSAGGTAAASALQMLATSDGIDLTQRSPIQKHEEATRLRLALLDRERAVLHRMRREGTIDDLVVRRIEAHLDLEEMRLSGIEQLD